MMKKIYKRKSHFTIVELLVAMGVFSILMLALMQFFTGAQQIWQKSSARSELFENARVALDLMATDLQCAYYEMNHSTKRIFFAADDYDSTSKSYGKIAFATDRSTVPADAGSRICQVQYIFYDGNPSNGDKKYTLCVDEVWDKDNLPPPAPQKWTVTQDQANTIAGISDFSKTAFSKTGKETEIIPRVIKFAVVLLDKADNPIDGADKFPYKVELTLTVVDKVTFDRWKSVSTDLNSDILKPGMRTFSRVVLIERGQYD